MKGAYPRVETVYYLFLQLKHTQDSEWLQPGLANSQAPKVIINSASVRLHSYLSSINRIHS